MKLVDYELILKGLREKYPGHTIDIQDTPGTYPWDESRKTLLVDGKETSLSWYGSIAADIAYASDGKVDPHNEISFILNEEVKKVLDIL